MWLLLALLGVAAATEPQADSAATPRTAASAHRAYYIGWWTGLLGKGTRLGGIALDDSRLRVGGIITQKVGIGTMLATGLKEREALVAQGGDVSAAWGASGWAVWGLSTTIDIGAPWIEDELSHLGPERVRLGTELLSITTAFASYVLAVAQHRRNMLDPSHESQTAKAPPLWTIRPVASGPFTGGVIAGQF